MACHVLGWYESMRADSGMQSEAATGGCCGARSEIPYYGLATKRDECAEQVRWLPTRNADSCASKFLSLFSFASRSCSLDGCVKDGCAKYHIMQHKATKAIHGA